MYRRFIIVLILMIVAHGNIAHAASIDLWPASLRKNKTAYVIEGELSKLMFNIYPNIIKGKYPLPSIGVNTESKSIVIVVDLPSDIEFSGSSEMWRKFCAKSNVKSESVTHDGQPYTRYSYPLASRIIAKRMSGNWVYYCQFWIKPSKKLNTKIYWKLLEDGKVLVNAVNPIITVGKVGKIPLPKHFKFVLYTPDKGIFQEMSPEIASLYKRIGVTHINIMYYNGWGANTDLVKALKQAGVKVLAQRGGSFMNDVRAFSSQYRNIGLFAASGNFCKALNSKTNLDEFSAVAEFADGSIWDAEYYNDALFPGYEDKKTILAFSLSKGLNKPLSLWEIKSKYRDEYRQYRMKLCENPIVAFSEMVRCVKSDAKVWICTGAGFANSVFDYKSCNKAYNYFMPMIYMTPHNFYNMLKSSKSVYGACKIVPATESGYVSTGEKRRILNRQKGGLLLDYMGAASLGCAGICDWPGAGQLESGMLYEYYQGAKMLAPVENFYFKGKPLKSVSAEGMAYVVKKIKLGTTILDMSQPKWSNHLIVRCNRYNKDVAVTLFNYHLAEDVFVRIKGKIPGHKNIYLINLYDGTYLSNRENYISVKELKNGVVVKVKAYTPAVWVLTSNPGRYNVRIAGMKRDQHHNDIGKNMKKLKKIKMPYLIKEFKKKKQAFLHK